MSNILTGLNKIDIAAGGIGNANNITEGLMNIEKSLSGSSSEDNIAEAINNGGSGSSSSGGGLLNIIITQDDNAQNGYSLNITKWSDIANAMENHTGINFELHKKKLYGFFSNFLYFC